MTTINHEGRSIPYLRDAWERWEEVVPPLMTKSQLAKAGYKTGRGDLPPPAAAIPAGKKSGYKYYFLYHPDECKRTTPLSEAQAKALAKAQMVADDLRKLQQELDFWCVKCGRNMKGRTSYLEYLLDMKTYDEWRCSVCRRHALLLPRVRRWARIMLASDAIILDTETTGLHNADVIEIGIISAKTGEVVLNTRVKNRQPIDAGAERVHGISEAMLADAPTFEEVYPLIVNAIEGRHLLIYNAEFDLSILNGQARRAGLPLLAPSRVTCAMQMYAIFNGEWSSYYRSWRWQRLPAGDHSAVGDCLAVQNVLREMAGL